MTGVTHWRRLGNGPRQALALHCTMAHSGAWRGLAAILGDRLTMHAPDMPGHGRSAPYDGDSCTGTLVYEAILERITDRVDVIAHSFGGVVALRLAWSHPELVRSLTLFEPVFFALAMMVDLDGFAAHEETIALIRERISIGDREGAARVFMEEWGAGTPWALLPEAARAGFAERIPFVVGSDNYVAFDQPGTTERLGDIAAPTVLLNGARSPAVIANVCDALARRMPNARRATFAGAGHMGALSHPQAMAEEVLRQIQTC